MHPILFRLGPLVVHTYGFFIALGFLAALGLILREARRLGVDQDRIMDLAFYMLLAGIVASRAAYILLNLGEFSQDFLEIFRLWHGGLVFYGGFLGAAAVYFFFLRRHQMPLWKTADLIAPVIPLGHAFGRLGCFSAGCCYGKVCDLPWAVTFTNPQGLAPLGVPLHPTQLYEALGNFVLFLIIFYLVRPRKRFDGQVFFTYTLLYAVMRFFIEFFRGDYRGGYLAGVLSPSQVAALLILASSAGLLVFLKKRRPA
ncbi:MAG: prolipoprotein diacylglyceryl transferase [Proteobacteria bacterium]|nr:prolipoprotein diacylglyceryl transferase [Pseudomonadota bacterium]